MILFCQLDRGIRQQTARSSSQARSCPRGSPRCCPASLLTGAHATKDVIVEVRDTGPELKPDRLEHLFDAFYTTKPGGMGMGLAICRSIIEAHGGRVSAAANAPQGAVFHFTLPANRTPLLD